MAVLTVGVVGADYINLQLAIDAASAGDRIEIIGPPGFGDVHTGTIDLNDLTLFTSTGAVAVLTLASGTPIATLTLEGNAFAVTGNETPTSITSSADILHTEQTTGALTVAGGGTDTLVGSGADDTLLGGSGTDGLIGGLGNDLLDLGISTATELQNRAPNEYVLTGFASGIDTVFNFNLDGDQTLNGILADVPDGSSTGSSDGIADGGADKLVLYGQDRSWLEGVAAGTFQGVVRVHIGQVEGSGGSAAWDGVFATQLAASGYTNPANPTDDWDVVIEIDYSALGLPATPSITILHDAIPVGNKTTLDAALEANLAGSFDSGLADSGTVTLNNLQTVNFLSYMGDSLAFYFAVDPTLVGHTDGFYAPGTPFQTFTTVQQAVIGASSPGGLPATPGAGDVIGVGAGDYFFDGAVAIDGRQHVAVSHEALTFILDVDADNLRFVLADDNVATAALNDPVLGITLGGLGGAKVVGNAGDNIINAETGIGSYEISGLGGNDHISVEFSIGENILSGGEGIDTIIGGSGDDSIAGDAGSDTLRGLGGNDLLVGGDGSDDIFGGDGDDRLEGSLGANTLNGGRGNDVIIGSNVGADVMRGGIGHDILIGFGGNDAVDLGDVALAGQLDPVTGLDANKGFTDSVVWGLEAGTDTVFNFQIDDGITDGQFASISDGAADRLTISGISRDFFQFLLTNGLAKISVGQAGVEIQGSSNLQAATDAILNAGYDTPTGSLVSPEPWDIVIDITWQSVFGLPSGAVVLRDVIPVADQSAFVASIGIDPALQADANIGLVELTLAESAIVLDGFGDSLGFLSIIDPSHVGPAGQIGSLGAPTYSSLTSAQFGSSASGLPTELVDGDSVTFNTGSYASAGFQTVNKDHLIVFTNEGATGLQLVLGDDNADTAAVNDAIVSLNISGAENVLVNGNSADNFISGAFSSGNNLFNGMGGNDTLVGGTGNDTLIGGVGNDTIIGGDGAADTASYLFASSAYTVTFNAGTSTYTIVSNPGNQVDEGTDTLTGVEVLAFNGGIEIGAIQSFVADTFDGRSDFTGDGDDDILFQFPGGAKILGNVGEASVFIGGADRTARLVGDFDGDSDTDILMELNANGAYILERAGEGNLYLGQSDRTARAVGDFDGDGDDDILFTLDANGGHILGNVGGANVYIGRTDGTAQAVGDFDGDGDDDILMKLTAGGAHLIEKIGEANVFIGGADRTARAVGDFDGDGDDDILMQLNGSGAYLIEKAGQANVYIGATDRTARAIGDFDGDGDDDILMQLNGSGAYVIEKIGEANTYLGATDRTARAVGDFDGDGDDDILMELTSNGGHVIQKIGEASVYIGQTDRDAVDLGLTDLGLAFEVV